MKPLLEFPVPTTPKKLDRGVGVSVSFSKWVGDFAIKAAPLLKTKQDEKIPLDTEAISSIETIKRAVSKAAVWIPDRTKPFVLKTDASGNVIGATITQNSKAVAFLSQKFSDQELNWSAIKKEAFAIVSSVQKRRQLLLGSHFTIVTDQKGVLYLFDSKPRSSIKNSQLCRWRLVISQYDFDVDVQYRKVKLNLVTDALSRVIAFCSQWKKPATTPYMRKE